MKGLLLNIRICIIAAFTIGLVMAISNLYPSWSQFAGNVQDPLLYATLFFITLAFMMTSFNYKDKRKVLFNLKGLDVRFEHLCRIISYTFGGVLIFSVNSEIAIVEILHFVFTGVSILLGYLLFLYCKKFNQLSIVLTMIGLCGFGLGFFFNIYSIAWAEVIAAAPLAYFLYRLNGV